MSAATESDTPIAGSKGHMGGTLIDVQDLVMHFPVTEGIIIPKVVANVKAVDGISFSIRKGETLGLVGESGCGKTTTGRCILRLEDATAGAINYEEFCDEAKPKDMVQIGDPLLENQNLPAHMRSSMTLGGFMPTVGGEDLKPGE